MNRRIAFILSGFFLGLGMYTYISFRLVPILVFLFILHEWYYFKSKSKIQNSMILYLTAFLVFLPLLIDYIHNPFHFFGRTEEISPFQQGIFSGIQLIFGNMVKTIGMFLLWATRNLNTIIQGTDAAMDSSVFLIIGLFQAFRNWKKLNYLIPLAWFIFFLLPSIFSVGAPNTLRTLVESPRFVS